jgi:hypothetical protein
VSNLTAATDSSNDRSPIQPTALANSMQVEEPTEEEVSVGQEEDSRLTIIQPTEPIRTRLRAAALARAQTEHTEGNQSSTDEPQESSRTPARRYGSMDIRNYAS